MSPNQKGSKQIRTLNYPKNSEESCISNSADGAVGLTVYLVILANFIANWHMPLP